MGKNKKKKTTSNWEPIPFNRFHSDLERESIKERRRKARDEEQKYKGRRNQSD